MHVDGALDLWALANPDFTALTEGSAEADSGATDINDSTFPMTATSSFFAERPICARRCRPASHTWSRVLQAIANHATTHPNPRGGRGVEIWCRPVQDYAHRVLSCQMLSVAVVSKSISFAPSKSISSPPLQGVHALPIVAR